MSKDVPVIENLGRNNFLKQFNHRTRAMNVLEREEKRKRHIRIPKCVGLVK